jgi:hypothetical protein
MEWKASRINARPASDIGRTNKSRAKPERPIVIRITLGSANMSMGKAMA